MKRLLILSFFLPFVCSGQTKVQQYVDTQMKNDPVLRNAVVSLLAVDEDDTPIASWNETLPLLSASNMKLVTTGTALLVLGADYRFVTRIAYSGEISDNGVLEGDLYIVGGGDPTLGSKSDIAYPLDSIFAVWTEAVRKEGIRRIHGNVVGDARFFSDDEAPDEWAWGDTGYYYGSSPSGLSFAENLISFEISPGQNVGDPATIKPLPPYLPGYEFTNLVTTGVKGSGDKTVYHTTELSPVGRFAGTYALGRKPSKLEVSNKFGALACAQAFSEYLSANGIGSRGVTDVAESDDLVYICNTYSPILGVIACETNHKSNNFYAETLFRTVAKILCGKDDYGSASTAVMDFVTGLTGTSSGYHQYDGSGLAPKNYISPQFMCEFLKRMRSEECFGTYFATLPVPGGDGTLKNLLASESAEIRSSVHAKSGSFSGCRCYSGYVDSKRGLIRFSAMVNNFSCKDSEIVTRLGGFIGELSKYANYQ